MNITLRRDEIPDDLLEFFEDADTQAKTDVFRVNTEAFREAHFATFPTKLVEPCILAGSQPGDTVLDPFLGSGTVGLVACRLGRKFLGMELSEEYASIARRRLGWTK